jgi:hypothetical protein
MSKKSSRWSSDDILQLLAKDQQSRRGLNQYDTWTDLDIVELISTYKGQDPVQIKLLPLKLNRSEASVRCKADALGITFSRGEYPREKKPIIIQQKIPPEELSKIRSERLKKRHAMLGHPMKGKEVTQETRDKISLANIGRKVPKEEIEKRMITRAVNGTMAPHWNQPGRSWKAGWREIGGQKIFARSCWEANYARYLQFLKNQGEILNWEHEPDTFWFEKIKRGVRSYLPDFKITFTSGKIEYHEVKGWMDPKSITKIRRMAKYHPTVILRIIGSDWFKANRRTMQGIIAGWE